MNKITEEDLEGLTHEQQVMFALFCAKQVEHLIESEEAKRCIEVTELWLDGKATAEECRTTANAAGYAANAAGAGYAAWAAGAARDAALDAAWAADAAADAISTKVNKQEILKQQHNYLYELKNIDKILEEELLT